MEKLCRELNFKEYEPWDERKRIEEEFMKQVEAEEDMDADQITGIMEKHLKKQKFLLAFEKNYVGYNKAPFDIVAGDEDNLRLIGFEVKSDKDTFDRLNNQLDEYAFICENIYLVLHKKKAPEWLPYWCGILRVSKEGKIYSENNGYSREPFEISTGGGWDTLSRANGLGAIKNRLNEIFKELINIRKNILFNRYFSQVEYSETEIVDKKFYKKFYPLTDEQKRLIIGFDVPYHLKRFDRDLFQFEKRLNNIKSAINLYKEK